jgi:hypothetical protein
MTTIPSRFYGWPVYNFIQGLYPTGFWDDSSFFQGGAAPITKVA